MLLRKPHRANIAREEQDVFSTRQLIPIAAKPLFSEIVEEAEDTLWISASTYYNSWTRDIWYWEVTADIVWLSRKVTFERWHCFFLPLEVLTVIGSETLLLFPKCPQKSYVSTLIQNILKVAIIIITKIIITREQDQIFSNCKTLHFLRSRIQF